jgi:hypothetical protein
MPVSQIASLRAVRELSGFAAIIALLMLFAAGKAVLHDTMDPDFFWHIRVAEQLQREGIHPIVDQLSFSSVKQPWAPYSWLGELAMKWIWDHTALRGAILTQAALEAIYVLLILLCAMQALPERTDDEPSPLMPLILSVALALFLALPYLSFRPVLMAIDLLAASALLLIRDRRLEERSRLVWLVPLITAITINVHIFALFIPTWIAAMLAGAWIERDRRAQHRYSILLVLCVLACLCTPMLRGTLAAIHEYVTTNPLASHSFITELEPMYRGTTHQVTLAIVAIVICWALAKRQLRPGEMLWLGGMLALWIKCGRAAPILAPMLAPVTVRAMPALSDRALGAKWVNLGAAAVLLIGSIRIGLAVPGAEPVDAWLNRRGPGLPGYPAAAAEFVDANVHRATGRLINEFDWGGYLAWKLPQYQVLLDGRTQLFTPDFWQAAYLDDPGKTMRLLATTDADAAVLPIGKSRFRESLRQLGWKRAFHDARAEVLVPPSSLARTEE